ncbi:hypothetical protein [Ramlibacter sp. AN1133]|uniref:hypothetical protein n=1 Tax=Ramlibacter sp. AN1133 TaxID=3133429 RepID=UPI0030BE23C5
MLIIRHIGNSTGSSIPGWPEVGTVAGLMDALKRWPLEPRLDMREDDQQEQAPYRGRAWGHCIKRFDQRKGRNVYEATKPIYPDSPDAVSYLGNFLGYSFAFSLDTDEPTLIAQLDAAIAENMARPDYQAAVQEIREREQAEQRRWASRQRA